MGRSLLESLAFVAWAIPCFLVLEAALPRTRTPVRWRALALACLLLAANSALVRVLRIAPPLATITTARIAGAWIATELGAYALHRAMHGVPLLWRIHRLHHADDAVAPLAFHRSWWIHPLDVALFTVTAGATTALAGAPLVAAPWFLIVRRAWGILLHANVRWPASWLDHLIVTPAIHHRHHRDDLPPANFAGSFAILDRVFGTWAR